MAKMTKKNPVVKETPKDQRLEALNKIIAGTADSEESTLFFSKDGENYEFIPRQYLDPIGKGIIQPRARLLLGLYRWAIPTMKGIQDATSDPNDRYKMPAIKLVCEVKRGHGTTTMAKKFNAALANMLQRDTQLSDKCYLLYVEKTGNIIADSNKLGNQNLVPLIVMDGAPAPDAFPQQYREIVLSIISSSSVFCFTEDKSQVKSLFHEEPFIVRAEPFTVENILEIAQANGYMPKRDDTLTFMKEKIEQMLEKDINPKSILNIIAASCGISLRDHSELHSSVDNTTIKHLFERLVEEHTEITTIESVPLDQLQSFISGRVMGQPEAITQVVNSIAVVQYNLKDKERPVYSFMFLGQTGVGKTELARSLSRGLFGREDIIRIDMGEYKMSHSVEKLFGAPQGYIGYGTETKLVRELKKRTKGILLLDEIEKAHPDVHDAILNMLDAGKFTTGSGSVIDMTGYIVIMTSNALVKEESTSKSIGFQTRDDKIGTAATIRKKLIDKGYFSPEFVNRINSVIWFNNITGEISMKILEKQFILIAEALQVRGIKLIATEKYLQSLLKQCDEAFGGRDVVRKADLARFEIVAKLREKPDIKEIVLDVDEKSSSLPVAKELIG